MALFMLHAVSTVQPASLGYSNVITRSIAQMGSMRPLAVSAIRSSTTHVQVAVVSIVNLNAMENLIVMMEAMNMKGVMIKARLTKFNLKAVLSLVVAC